MESSHRPSLLLFTSCCDPACILFNHGETCLKDRNNHNRLRLTGSRLGWGLSSTGQGCDYGRYWGSKLLDCSDL